MFEFIFRSVQLSDEGCYLCEINTEPLSTLIPVYLSVIRKFLFIKFKLINIRISNFNHKYLFFTDFLQNFIFTKQKFKNYVIKIFCFKFNHLYNKVIMF